MGVFFFLSYSFLLHITERNGRLEWGGKRDAFDTRKTFNLHTKKQLAHTMRQTSNRTAYIESVSHSHQEKRERER